MSTQMNVAVDPTRDYYGIMHLHPEAEAAMVDTSYWHLARLYNAAIPNNPSAGAKLDDLNHAYSVLGSPTLRRQYDHERDTLPGGYTSAAPPLLESEPAHPAVVMALPPEAGADAPAPLPQLEPEPTHSGVAMVQPPESGADSEPQRSKTRGRLRLRRPRWPGLSIGWVRLPSWRGSVAAAIILVMAPAAFIVGQQAILLVVLLVIALAVTALRLVRRPPRLPGLNTFRRPAVRPPRLPQPSLRPHTDADALHRSTRAMLQRLHHAAESLPNPDDAARIPNGEPSLAGPPDRP